MKTLEFKMLEKIQAGNDCHDTANGLSVSFATLSWIGGPVAGAIGLAAALFVQLGQIAVCGGEL